MKITHNNTTRHTALSAIHFALILAACIFFSTGCLADALEPNNDLASATLIDGDSTHSGLQVSAADTDFILLMPLTEGRMAISLDMGSGSLPFNITIHTGEVVGGNVVIVDSETDEGVSETYSKSFDILTGQVRVVEILCEEPTPQSYSFVTTLVDFSLAYAVDYRIVPSQMPEVLTAGQPCGFDVLIEERAHPYALWTPSTLGLVYYQFWQSEDLVGGGRTIAEETGVLSLTSSIGGLSVVPCLAGILDFRFYDVDPESSPGARPIGHAGPISVLPGAPAAIDVTNLDGDNYFLFPWLPGAGLSDIGRWDADGKAAYDIEVQVVDDFGNAIALEAGDVLNLDLAVDHNFQSDIGLEVELHDFAFKESTIGSEETAEEDDDASGVPVSYTSFPLATVIVSTTVTRARGRLLLQTLSLMPQLTSGSLTQVLYFQGMVNGVQLQAQAVNGGAAAAPIYQKPVIKFGRRGEKIPGSGLKHRWRYFTGTAQGGAAAGGDTWPTLIKGEPLLQQILYNAYSDNSYTSTPNDQSLGPGTFGHLTARSTGSYHTRTLDPDDSNDPHRSAYGWTYQVLDDSPVPQAGEIAMTSCRPYLEGKVYFKSAGDADLYVENSIDDAVAAASWSLQHDGLRGNQGRWNISAQYDGGVVDDLFELLATSVTLALPVAKVGKFVLSISASVLLHDSAPDLATGPNDISDWEQDFSRSWALDFKLTQASFLVETAWQAQAIIDKTSMSSGMSWAIPSCRVSWQAHLVCLDSRGKKGATAVGSQRVIDAKTKFSYVEAGAMVKYPGITEFQEPLLIDWIGE